MANFASNTPQESKPEQAPELTTDGVEGSLPETSEAPTEAPVAAETPSATPDATDLEVGTASPITQGGIEAGYYDADGGGDTYGGWIEPSDKSWIIFLNKAGKPITFYGTRLPGGAVVGEAQILG